MQPATFDSWKISELHDHLLQRRFAVPKLQRNFVWDGRRAAKLLDSVYRSMPIGSLFLWEMDRKSAHLIRQSTKVLPAFSTTNPKIWFVIDGQQRLSVIYQSLMAETRKNDAGKEIDFRRLCFVVNPSEEDKFASRIVYRKEVEREFVPLADLLATDWKKRIVGGTLAFRKKVEDCRVRLLGYKVPIVKVTSASLPEIAEVFTRVNSLGMKVTAADRAIALMGKLDMHAMADELRQKILDVGFSLRGIDQILMGFNLVTEKLDLDGDPPKLEVMAKRWSKKLEADKGARESFKKLWHRYQDSFLTAVQYLRSRFPVHDESFLPSANMIATLSVFFFHHKGQPTATQAAEIRKWFWATGVGTRYSGAGYHRNIVQDAKLFQAIGEGEKRKFTFPDLIDPAQAIAAETYNASSARTRAFFCLLASLGPRYLDNGEEIPLGPGVLAPSNQTHRHHIFPRAQLRKNFAPSAYNSLCNICFLVSLDNQRIGQKLPRIYLADYKGAGRSYFQSVMKSHLIPVRPDSGVWAPGIKSGFKQFRTDRLEIICKAYEAKAGIKLFQQN
jgi:hypothetical protein